MFHGTSLSSIDIHLQRWPWKSAVWKIFQSKSLGFCTPQERRRSTYPLLLSCSSIKERLSASCYCFLTPGFNFANYSSLLYCFWILQSRVMRNLKKFSNNLGASMVSKIFQTTMNCIDVAGRMRRMLLFRVWARELYQSCS